MSSRITVLGTGYLGATHAACMAELGHEVLGADVDPDELERLQAGRAPFYEAGPALNISGQLQLRGTAVTVYDPKVMADSQLLFPTPECAPSAIDACRGADVTVVLSEWPQFRELAPVDLDAIVRHRNILDGRNCLNPEV